MFVSVALKSLLDNYGFSHLISLLVSIVFSHSDWDFPSSSSFLIDHFDWDSASCLNLVTSLLSLPGCCLKAEAVARPLPYTSTAGHYRQPRTVVRVHSHAPVLATVQGQGYKVRDFPLALGGSGAGVVRSLSCKAITVRPWQWTAGLPVSPGRCPMGISGWPASLCIQIGMYRRQQNQPRCLDLF